MVCDSFTSNWQSKIFKDHAPSSMMMMAVVNLFSSSFTLASLFLGGEVRPTQRRGRPAPGISAEP
jgi:adenosine 3'-phospho 5'-phosphosulfate transporter B2